MPLRFCNIALPVLAAALLLLTGCHAKRSAATATRPAAAATASSRQRPAAPSAIATGSEEPLRLLMAEADKWIGTPYRYGARERGKGTDCSGFVMSVFDNALAIKLPRNSAEQQQWCSPLTDGYRNAAPGDLIFLAGTKGGVNHVGIYLGDGKMVHASTSQGVVVSNLADAYYTRRFHSAGRVAPLYAMLSKSYEPAKAPAEPVQAPAEPVRASSLPSQSKSEPSQSKSEPAKAPAEPVRATTEPAKPAVKATDARSRLLQRLQADSIAARTDRK